MSKRFFGIIFESVRSTYIAIEIPHLKKALYADTAQNAPLFELVNSNPDPISYIEYY